MVKTLTLISLAVFSVSAMGYTTQSLTEKSQAASEIVNSFQTSPDRSIPLSLLRTAVCIAAVPNVIRGGFIFGASHGEGLVSCRANGVWSEPVFFSVTGGSWGWQIGVDVTDLVMVFVGPNAVARLSEGNLTLGSDLSVAAGPLGRDAQLGTDYQLKSEIVSYSQSRGLFAGLTLNGTIYSIATAADELAYGARYTPKQILSTTEMLAPDITSSFVTALRRLAP